MSQTRKMAILVIEPNVLRQLLHLPAEAEIVHVQSSQFGERGVVEIVVEGCGWQTNEGEIIPRASGAARLGVSESGNKYVESINWGFPK